MEFEKIDPSQSKKVQLIENDDILRKAVEGKSLLTVWKEQKEVKFLELNYGIFRPHNSRYISVNGKLCLLSSQLQKMSPEELQVTIGILPDSEGNFVCSVKFFYFQKKNMQTGVLLRNHDNTPLMALRLSLKGITVTERGLSDLLSEEASTE